MRKNNGFKQIKRGIIRGLVIGVPLAFGLLTVQCNLSNYNLEKRLHNKVLPELVVRNLEGESIKINEGVGEKMIIGWGAHCAPCEGTRPTIEKFIKEKGRNISIYLVNRGDSGLEVERYLKRHPTLDESLVYTDFDRVYVIVQATEDNTSLKILLAGQEYIKNKLKAPNLYDLAKRINVFCQLEPINKQETDLYIDFQLKKAGANSNIFDDDVKTLIFEHSNGYPRQINNIATACLLQATALNKMKIDLSIFNQIIPEINPF